MKNIWMDADPGVDDTFALGMLFGLQEQMEAVDLLTVFGKTVTA